MSADHPVRRARGFDERAQIALLDGILSAPGIPRGGVEVGIGDDAAVLAEVRGRLVWTVDVCVEGVHFKREWLSLQEVGWRSFHAAASDLAAMGARPVAALSSLVLPRSIDRRQLGALVRGQAEASRRLACPIVGGNLSSGAELSITTSFLGAAERPLQRAGAAAGQELWLAGEIGVARAGLELLASGVRRGPQAKARAACVRAWRRPEALVGWGRRLARRASAAVDVSDGLAGDVGHLARASHVRVVLVERLVRECLRPELRAVAALLGNDPLDWALHGGEDYALVAAGGKSSRPRGVQQIGYVERGTGVVLLTDRGTTERLAGGFDHFRG